MTYELWHKAKFCVLQNIRNYYKKQNLSECEKLWHDDYEQVANWIG